MKRTGYGLAMALVAGLAGAAHAQGVAEAPKPGAGPLRDFTLRNNSDHTIDDARITLSSGATVSVTARGKITTLHAQSFKVPAGECVKTAAVTLQGGRELNAEIADCHASALVVRNDEITTASSAVPGTTVKPGEGPRGTSETR